MSTRKAQLHAVDRNALTGDTVPAELFDVAWEPHRQPRRLVVEDWKQYMAVASQVVGRFHGQFVQRHFDYLHPTTLQPATPRRLKREYPVSVAYNEWGRADAPLLVCCGGVAHVATRFNYLASDLARDFRVVCMDWLGRGRSGWLAAQEDYSLHTYAEQLRQFIVHLGGGPLTVLGSSLGGSAAIELIARHPGLVNRLILNDVGPQIPGRRRRRRAQTIARHYVFRDPGDLLRKLGASAKNDGPVSDDIRFNLTFHQTKWSDEEGGRVYRHDVRALQAYRHDSQYSLMQWEQWRRVNVPMLLIHGMQSDALLESTIERMRRNKDLALMHIPDTGHSPLLADRNHCWFIREWLLRPQSTHGDWSALHAAVRDPLPGSPIAFAPMSALRR